MIIGLEWWICSWKTTISKLLAEQLNWIFVEEHTPRIKNKEAFNLDFKSELDFKKTFNYFLDVELERNLNLDKNKIYIFDRTVYSLLWFAYAKWKIDKLNYLDTINDNEYKSKIQKIDFIFIIDIDNNDRIHRLNNDIFRKNNTPELFYSCDFNKYNNCYLKNINHSKKFYINWNDSIENILNFILKTIWKNI